MSEQVAFTSDPELSFWPTPGDVADDLVILALCPGYGQGEAAGGVPQVRILEPSAGEGHLARVARKHLPGAHITAVEPAPQRAAVLRAQAGLADEVVESTLDDYLAGAAVAAIIGELEPFELVFMNPPFTLPGHPEAWAEHVLAIWNAPHLVNPGGTVAAVVPHVALTGKSKLVRTVRALLGKINGRYPDGMLVGEYGSIAPCAKGAFAPVGAGVSTVLLRLHKPIEGE